MLLRWNTLRLPVTALHFVLFGLFATAAGSLVYAQEVVSTENVLPAINVSGATDIDYGFTAQKAVSSTKSDKPLFETPQSISVLTRELLDSRQVTTLNEAIQTTAGVSSGGFGRRGWDDFSIRGQRASESIYVDGLKLGQSNWIAQEVYGVERIEIVKGPASINFGQMQPGGIVNMVSKRPRQEAFNEVGFSVGSYGYRQGTFDFGRPLQSENGKAAFRINGMASDSDDPTDFVYFKNRYIAPSLSLDFGPRTDFTILTAFDKREYIRQQGLPTKGTLQANPNGKLDRDLFIGDPGIGPYEAEQASIGYSLTHRFDSGWKLQQNFRWQQIDMIGRAVFVRGALQNNTTQPRSVTFQDVQGNNYGLDTNVEKAYDIGGLRHTVMVGLDLNRDELRNGSNSCNIASLNIYNPVYNLPYTCNNPMSMETTTVSYAALYLRDQIKINDRLSVNLALRHDRVNTKTVDNRNGDRQNEDSSANTGNVALMYQVTQNIAPYISYATSFLPITGTDFFGTQFKPEEGEQSEIGVKFQSDDKRLNASLAYYDLTRQNVTVADPDPTHPNSSVQIGEQRSKGYEAEITADLRNGWSLQGALSLVDAEITDDTTASNIGKRLQNVPRRTASAWANYRFRDGVLSGWGAGLGVRHESSKTGPAVSFSVPGYTVADANVSYQGAGYRVMLNVKNLFDKDYYAGTLNNFVVPLGDPRTVMLKAVFDF